MKKIDIKHTQYLSRVLSVAIVCLGTVFSLTAAAESALMIKADKLRAKPYTDATLVVTLTAKQKVDIIARSGAWYQVSVAGKKGWVNMLSVRKTTAAATASAGSLSTVAAGRSGTGSIVATTGVRGLNEEKLSHAVYSETAVTASEKFRVSADEATQFALAGGLKVRKVPVLSDKTK